MSTILKALRRLEEERTAKAERALREQVVGAAPRAAGSWRRLALRALAAALGVAVLSLALSSWRARRAAQPVAAPAAATAAVQPTPPPQTATGATPPTPPPGLVGGATAAAPLPPPAPSPASIVAMRPPGASAILPGANAGPAASSASDVRAAAAALAPRPDVAVVQRPPSSPPDLPQEPAQANEAPRAPEAAPPGAPPPLPRRAPVNSAAEPPSAAEQAATPSVPLHLQEVDPSLHSPYGIREDAASRPKNHAKLSHPQASASTSEVLVTRTTWHPSAERRLAVVRGAGDSQDREVHEGDSVGSLQVLRIEPSGVVFLRQGVEIRQRVGTLP